MYRCLKIKKKISPLQRLATLTLLQQEITDPSSLYALCLPSPCLETLTYADLYSLVFNMCSVVFILYSAVIVNMCSLGLFNFYSLVVNMYSLVIFYFSSLVLFNLCSLVFNLYSLIFNVYSAILCLGAGKDFGPCEAWRRTILRMAHFLREKVCSRRKNS